MNEMSNYHILNKLSPQLRASIKLVCIFGEKGREVILVTNDDKVFAMGSNTDGCLGLSVANRLDVKIQLIFKPSIVPELCDKQIINITYGLRHVLALTKTNDVYSWGNNKYGQLGRTITGCAKPGLIIELRNVSIKSISCGFYHTLALTESGDIYAFGCNECGQIGSGISGDQLTPIKLDRFSDEPIVAIACGASHSLALSNAGRVYGWGCNRFGQLSDDNSNYFEAKPLLFHAINFAVTKIVCSAHSSLVMTHYGFIALYGNNLRNATTVENYCNIRFENIVACILFDVFAAKTIDGKYYVLGEWDDSPRKCLVNTFHSLFAIYATPKVTYLLVCADEPNCYTQNSIDLQSNSSVKFMPNACCKQSECAVKKFETYLSITNFLGDNHSSDGSDDSLIDCEDMCSQYEQCDNSLANVSENHLQTGRYEREFNEIELLGCGGFGSVYKAMHKQNDTVYAIKKVETRGDENWFNELKVWTNLNTRYVVQHNCSWIELNQLNPKSSANKTRLTTTSLANHSHLSNDQKDFLLYIQMELCCSTLRNTLDRIKTELSDIRLNNIDESFIRVIYYYIASELFLEILECVHYLHTLDIPVIHRDLKASNILITDGSNGRFVKIADFGLATTHSFDEQSHTKCKGTPIYVAPEVIIGNKYTTKVDNYSLGILMEQMFNTEADDSFIYLDSRIKAKSMSACMIHHNLVSSLPANRPSCQSVIRQKFMWSLSLEELIGYESFASFCRYMKGRSYDDVDHFTIRFMRKKLSIQRKSERLNRDQAITQFNSNETEFPKLKQLGLIDASDYFLDVFETIKHKFINDLEEDIAAEQYEEVITNEENHAKVTLIIEKGVKVEGLSKVVANNFKTLLDFETLKWEINGELYLSQLKALGNYRLSGRVFQFLPVTGNGLISIGFRNITGFIKLILTLKDNAFNADEVDIKLSFAEVELHLENLIDPNLSSVMNKLINLMAKPLIDRLVLENREKMDTIKRSFREEIDRRLKQHLDVQQVIDSIK